MGESREHHQVGRPGVNRADQPAELNFRGDVLHAFEGFARSRTVIKEQQNSRADLDSEEEKSNSTEEVPIAETVNGNSFFAQRSDQGIDIKTFIEPFANHRESTHVRPPASC